MRGVILDKEFGNFIQIDSNRVVFAAIHGTKKPLSQEEIQKIYGSDPISFVFATTPRYWCCSSYFEIPYLYAFGIMIDWYDSHSDVVHKINPQTSRKEVYATLNEAIFCSVGYNFGKWNHGNYFPELISNTGKYIEKRPKVKQWLRQLRNNGQKVALITNSSFDYTKVLLSYAFGDDWEDSFDLKIYQSNKPSFFLSELPFTAVGSSEVVENLELNGSYVGGNVLALNKFFVRVSTQESHPICYFGDDVFGDIVSPLTAFSVEQKISWSTFAIVEEGEDQETWPDYLEYKPTGSVCNHLTWGSFFSFKGGAPYWYHLIETNSILSLSCLESAAFEKQEFVLRKGKNIESLSLLREEMKEILKHSQEYKNSLASKTALEITPISFNLRRS